MVQVLIFSNLYHNFIWINITSVDSGASDSAREHCEMVNSQLQLKQELRSFSLVPIKKCAAIGQMV